jgi:hypothetical protein
MKFLTALSLIVMLSAPAFGVQLRFSPADQLIELAESGSLSVMLDDVLDLRTVELWVSYDESILLSEGGVSGDLLVDTGCMIWADMDDGQPGSWHGFAVILDAYCWATGPGELFRWDFSSIEEGYSRIHVENVRLFDDNGDPIENVSLADTYVFVGDQVTSLPEDPPSSSWSLVKSLY